MLTAEELQGAVMPEIGGKRRVVRLTKTTKERREAYRLYNLQWDRDNAERIAEWRANWRKDNQHLLNAQQRLHRARHGNKVRSYQANYARVRRANLRWLAAIYATISVGGWA